VGCITAIQSRLSNFQLRIRFVRCHQPRAIHAQIPVVDPVPLVSGTLIPVEEHAMQALLSKEKASNMKNSARLVLMNHSWADFLARLPLLETEYDRKQGRIERRSSGQVHWDRRFERGVWLVHNVVPSVSDGIAAAATVARLITGRAM